MANRIQLRRGIKSKLPTLTQGEPAYTTDTHELFVGTGSGNVNMGGSQWLTGTSISGTSGACSYSGCPLVKLGDKYLNTSNGNVYECTTAGSGTSAQWTYKGCIKGAQGATGPQGPTGPAGAKGDNASITGAASTITSSNLTANRALISNSSGKVAVSDVTSTELGYLDGVTSNVQMQLNSKVGKAGTGEDSFIANGHSCTADGATSFAFGYVCKASGARSFAGGIGCQSSEAAAFTFGNENIGLEAQTKFGHYATEGTQGNALTSTGGDAFFIGNGGGPEKRSNAFRVAYSGDVYGLKSFHSSGADYAEFFEWLDGNPDSVDRTGLFVTLDGDKIRLANADDDYILGVVSAAPGVIGNDHADTWQGMWLTDIFGRVLTHTVHHDAEYDDEGNLIHDACDAVEPIVNPDYNPDEKYIPREKRKEWGVVGMMGQLVVIDDGTCKVNGCCKVADGGTATASESGYRVIARLDDTHVKVLFR